VVALLALQLLLNVESLRAQPAQFEEGVLTLPGVAIFGADPEEYFRDIILEADQDGRLQVTSAEQAIMAEVESVAVEIAITVKVTGNKSVPCVDLAPPAVQRKGNVFTVVLAETGLQDGLNCITVQDSFQTSITLTTESLEPGTYVVRVNGEESTFEVVTNQ
jgi:hypothetical protein